MAKKEASERKDPALAEQIITNLIILAIGVLFCLKTKVDLTVGIALCLYGVITLVLAATKKRSLFSAEGIFAGVIIALGVAFLADKLLQSFVKITPYILCGVGLVLILDAFLGKFHRKDTKLFWFILELVAGAACLAFGICMIFVDSFKGMESVVFGISLVIFAVYRLVSMILRKKG